MIASISTNKTKLRLLIDNRFGKKEYIAHKDAANLLLLKLNMTDLKANCKGKYEDVLCRRLGLKKNTLNICFIAESLKKNL